MVPANPTPANDTFIDADADPGPVAETMEASTSPSGRGITYSPYTNSVSDGNDKPRTSPINRAWQMACKSQGAIHEDLKKMNGYHFVRIYGTDCNQAMTVSKAAKALNKKVMAGIFDLNNVENEAHMVLSAIKAHGVINAVSVGNEAVNSGTASPGQVVAAIKKVRQILRNGGYKGPVVTVDTFVAIIANPSLCHASDFAAANIQAYFDGGVTAAQSGQFVRTQRDRVHQACGAKKRVVVTEAGWPSKGRTNGQAVPSPANQKKAAASVKSHLNNNIFLFTAYNDLWKQPGPYGVEQSFGILN